MNESLSISVVAIVAISIAMVLFLRSKQKEQGRDISIFENSPLPPEAGVYRRMGFIFVLMLLTLSFGFLFIALTISALSSHPIALIITVPLTIFAASLFYKALRQLLFDTSLSPWGKPIIFISLNGIFCKERWSISWSDVNAIRYINTGQYRSPTPYMLLTVKDRQRFPKNSWMDSAAVAAALKVGIVWQDTLLVELGSISLPLCEFQVLVKRYWCAARGKECR